jgi:hypothetical protein
LNAENNDTKRHASERLFGALIDLGIFSVDTEGRVWNANGDRAEFAAGGYLHVSIIVGGRTFRIAAHRLVYLAFYGTIPAGLVINHRNNDGTDNRLANLELATAKHNIRHAVKFRPSREAIVQHVRRKLAETTLAVSPLSES